MTDSSHTLTRRRLVQAAGAGAAALAWPSLLGGPAAAQAAGRRPNLVLILADDLGYGELGCYGQARIATPNLDRLAAEGRRFTDCYAGAPVCAPSRCSLLTGMHGGHSRVRTNYGSINLLPEDVTFAEVVRQAGYRTALIGKWGFGPDDPEDGRALSKSHPNAKGFDEFFGYLGHNHAHDYYPDHLWENDHRVLIPENVPNGPDVQRRYAPDLLIERAVDYIGRAGDAPFLLVLSSPLPHAPNNPPGDGAYAAQPWPPGERAHAEQITLLDGYVGQVAAALRQAGLARDTVVLCTSDNGPHAEGGDEIYVGEDQGRTHDPAFFASSGPLRGEKRSLYEGGIRVPMIAWAPGRLAGAGTVSAVPWTHCDLLPTFAELAGITPPEDVDGVSRRAAILSSPAAAADEALYWFRLDYGSERAQLADAVRRGSLKAIRFTPVPPPAVWREDPDAYQPGAGAIVELYDLAADPGETRDLAAANPALVAELVALMDAAFEPAPYPRQPWVGEPVPSVLAIRVPRKVRRAADAKRAIDLTVTSPDRLTRIRAVLVRRVAGADVEVARGRLAVLDGRATLRLRVTGRIRRRRYRLVLTGRTPDGAAATRTVTLRFK